MRIIWQSSKCQGKLREDRRWSRNEPAHLHTGPVLHILTFHIHFFQVPAPFLSHIAPVPFCKVFLQVASVDISSGNVICVNLHQAAGGGIRGHPESEEDRGEELRERGQEGCKVFPVHRYVGGRKQSLEQLAAFQLMINCLTGYANLKHTLTDRSC